MAKEASNDIILGDEEKRKKILELRYVYRKNTRDIAKELMVSFKTIAATCREYEEMMIKRRRRGEKNKRKKG
jgi:transposase